MKTAYYIAAILALSAFPLAAQDLPPGIIDARLLPGWTDGQGNRISALEIRLEPGWKTYWRNPGDSGLPPSFAWQESENLEKIEFHWPAPEVITSGGEQTLGYHDVLILPFTAVPQDKNKPVELRTDIALGVCEKICVPVHLSLMADNVGSGPNPVVQAALAEVPKKLSNQPVCTIKDIEDGMQLTVDLPKHDTQAAAMELEGRPDVWVSSAKLDTLENTIRATADFIEPSGKPFDLDASKLRVTQIGAESSVETMGCLPAD